MVSQLYFNLKKSIIVAYGKHIRKPMWQNKWIKKIRMSTLT